MKPAQYSYGVQWIALNDCPADAASRLVLAEYISVLLLADLFSVTPEKVAADVFEFRRAERQRTSK